MRVLIVAEAFVPAKNGVVTSVCNLAEELLQAGYSLGVAAPFSDEGRVWATTRGIEYFSTPAFKVPLQPIRLAVPGRLRPIARRTITIFRPDVIHIHAPVALGRAYARAGHRRANVAVVSTVHLLAPNLTAAIPMPPIFRPFVDLILSRVIAAGVRDTAVLIAPSHFAKSVYETWEPTSRIEVVSNGVDLERWGVCRTTLGMTQKLRLLYLGRLQREKQVDVLLRALVNLRGRGLGHSLVIAGSGRDRKRLERIVDIERLRGIVVFRGAVDDYEAVALMNDADVFCVPSPYELQCCAALEAMASGVPVIGAYAGALPETIRPGVGGLCFRAGDHVDLADQVMRLTADCHLYSTLASGARSTGRLHDRSISARRIMRLYDEIAR